MTDRAATAYAAFKHAVEHHVSRFRAMATPDFIARCMDMISEAPDLDPSPEQTISELLERLARDGSIEAAAALAVMGVDEQRLIALLRGLLERSPDAVEGCQVEALVIMFEEWADEEVAAGRMTVTVGPDGKKLYGLPKP